MAAVTDIPEFSAARGEQETDDGLFSIDIALPPLPESPKQRLAIEVDGPTHFTKAGVPNTSTRLRNLLLERRGWTVISIPVDQWVSMERDVGGKQACQEYIRKAVRHAIHS